jgi:lipid-binding SYLF domain-containing protein
MTRLLRILSAIAFVGVAGLVCSSGDAVAGSAQIDREVDQALESLYAANPGARTLGSRASAILVFPEVVKGGFVLGGLYGEGALRKNGKTAGYYSTTAISYGLQAGVQKYGYALFLMTSSALKYLDDSDGWELGVGPSIVVLDEGIARTLTTTTMKDDIYAIIFDQRGLMAGMGLQGSKIMKIDPAR